ncbi:hypothetical protein SAMN02910358_01426 [Lachnospiraceae bacterium XBB1006]|nr:hypothetical protein SAMN02910358_01426 [Lachnospiraceae bacterium XBB1006]
MAQRRYFLQGKLRMGWPNVWGLCIVILLLIPNIIYAIKAKGQQNQCKNKWMNCLEQVGRYGCMIFMILNFEKMGFFSAEAFVVYMFGNILLLLSYGIIWIMFFCKKTYWKQTALAVIPICASLCDE